MFVRFVVGSDGEHHRELTGIVTEARLLRDAGRLSAEEATQLEKSYNWLNDHLPVPPFSTRSWPRDVVAWFRDDAHDAIARKEYQEDCPEIQLEDWAAGTVPEPTAASAAGHGRAYGDRELQGSPNRRST